MLGLYKRAFFHNLNISHDIDILCACIEYLYINIVYVCMDNILHVAVCCSALQFVAVYCSAVQCVVCMHPDIEDEDIHI